MAFEHKRNAGSLFNNDRKSAGNSPDRKGTANVDGVMYYVSAWVKPGRGGGEWLSLSFTPMESKPKGGEDGDSEPF